MSVGLAVVHAARRMTRSVSLSSLSAVTCDRERRLLLLPDQRAASEIDYSENSQF
jgi:hypothetical protein